MVKNYCPFRDAECRIERCMVYDEKRGACAFLTIARWIGK